MRAGRERVLPAPPPGGAALLRPLASTVLAGGLSALALWYLLSDAVRAALAEALAGARWWPLGLGLALVAATQALRAWRYGLLARGSLAPPGAAMFAVATRQTALNLLLPFRLGEVGFLVMMKRTFGTEYSRGLGILGLARLMDLGVVGAMLAFGAAFLVMPAPGGLGRSLLVLLGGAALFAPAASVELLAALRRPIARVGWLRPWSERLFWAVLMVHAGPRRVAALGLTVAIWSSHAVVAYLAARAVAADLGFLPLALATAASNLTVAIPATSIAGLGPPQVAFATALRSSGAVWEPAVVAALAYQGVVVCGVLTSAAATFVLPFWQSQRVGRQAP